MTRNARRNLLRAVGSSALAALPGRVFSQAWPSKPIRLIVPIAPGSAPDIVARLVGDRLGALWGHPLLIDNRPGAGGIPGMSALARSAPDGLTFGFVPAAMGTVAPLVFKQPQFDPDKDLAPVATVGLSPLVVAVAANSPVQSLADLVRLSKANPGKLNFAAPQLNSLPHLAGELLNKTGSLGLFTVPYRSPPEAVSALLSGDAAVTIDGLPSVLPQVRAGRLRALGVTSARRLPGIDIPAIAETFPGYELTGWFQIMAPAGTPPAIIDRFNADLNRVTASAEIASRLNELGIYPRQDSVKAARDFFDEQQIAMKRVMSELGIQAQ